MGLRDGVRRTGEVGLAGMPAATMRERDNAMAEATNERPLLELRNITVRYQSGGRDVLAVEGLDLVVPERSFVSLIGPSGCGKSSVLNVMAGYLRPVSGEALMLGSAIVGPGPDRSVVHQQTSALLPWLNVEDNVALGLLAQNLPKARRREAAKHYLELVRLSGFEKHPIYHLSGGMRQRVALARALATESKVVLLDEPLGAIDALQRGLMQDFLLRLWSESGRSFFLITHSVDEAIYLGTSVLAMSPRPGRIIARRDTDFGRRALREGGPKVRRSSEFLALQSELLEILTSAGSGETQTS
ncbi:MAG: ABC transporter ATP-binding protein [Parvibaculaceae bacterium]